MAEMEVGVAQRQCLARRIAPQAEAGQQPGEWAFQRNVQHYGTDWSFRTKPPV